MGASARRFTEDTGAQKGEGPWPGSQGCARDGRDAHDKADVCLRVVMVTLLSRAFVWSQKEGSQALHSLGKRLSVKLLN